MKDKESEQPHEHARLEDVEVPNSSHADVPFGADLGEQLVEAGRAAEPSLPEIPILNAKDAIHEPCGPRYQQPTQVLPKGFLQGAFVDGPIVDIAQKWISLMTADYSNATTEHITTVFSTGTALSRGIRSLPDALSPDFRQKLYEQLVETGRR